MSLAETCYELAHGDGHHRRPPNAPCCETCDARSGLHTLPDGRVLCQFCYRLARARKQA